jgi:hypothetical protein
MDMTYAIIHVDDDTYVHLPNLTMVKNHVEEIDLDPESEEIPEIVNMYKLYPSNFDFELVTSKNKNTYSFLLYYY